MKNKRNIETLYTVNRRTIFNIFICNFVKILSSIYISFLKASIDMIRKHYET